MRRDSSMFVPNMILFVFLAVIAAGTTIMVIIANFG